VALRSPGPPKRRFRRRTVRVLVDFQVEGVFHCEYATTLGAGGMFLDSDLPLAIGTRLKLRFRLPGSEGLHEIEGRVAWRHGAEEAERAGASLGIGVEFTDAVGAAALARALDELPD
jgi:uncharacterized protein (TIGR02266 family)